MMYACMRCKVCVCVCLCVYVHVCLCVCVHVSIKISGRSNFQLLVVAVLGIHVYGERGHVPYISRLAFFAMNMFGYLNFYIYDFYKEHLAHSAKDKWQDAKCLHTEVTTWWKQEASESHTLADETRSCRGCPGRTLSPLPEGWGISNSSWCLLHSSLARVPII